MVAVAQDQRDRGSGERSPRRPDLERSTPDSSRRGERRPGAAHVCRQPASHH